MLRRTLALTSALVFSGVAALAAGGCGGECPSSSSGCGSDALPCRYAVEVTASVPPIDGQTWTVKGCLGSTCNSAPVDAYSGYTTGLLQVFVDASDGGSWELSASLSSPKPKTGQTWSLLVTDTQGNVIVQGQGTVHYTQKSGYWCASQEVSIP